MNIRLSLGLAALSGCVVAALVCVFAPAPIASFSVLSGATALGLLPLLASVDALREHAPSRGLYAAIVGFGLSTAPLSLLARVLKVTTHHRPLGAVTFAFLAAFCVLGTLVLALRVLLAPELQRLGRLLMGLSALSVLGLVVSLTRSAGTRTGVVHVALALGCASLSLLVPWPERTRAVAERAGPWLWAALVTVALVSALGRAGAAATTASPALAAIFSWF